MRLSDRMMAPSWIVIQLLEHCNLRCRMCYEWGETGAYHAREPAMLELPLVLRTVEECLPARPAFEFFGGEPLLYPGIWEVIARIREGRCGLAFPTNGMLLEEHAERLVATAPTRIWVSLDGPEAVNDRQRGRGVFRRVVRGMERLRDAKRARGSAWPQVGVTCVVTPSNHGHVEELFLRCLDLSMLDCVSIELQSWATAQQAGDYARVLADRFGVAATPCANAYVREPAAFAGIDAEGLTAQMRSVARACAARGILFHSQPRTLEVANIRSYLSGRWEAMSDRRSRCAVPWVSAEITARGDVTPCHTFHDLTIGNIHEQGLLEIWRGSRLKQLQSHLRDGLFPICTACCRYYGGAGAVGTPPAEGS